MIRLTTEYPTVTTSKIFLSYRKRRRQAILHKMKLMRAAKERKRLARGPIEEEPKMQVVRHPFLSWAMRDELSGEVCWMEFKSVRDMAKRAGVVAKFYQPVKFKL